MALIIIKIEEKDVNTSKIGLNYKIECGNIQIVFSPEALEELIKDYTNLKEK